MPETKFTFSLVGIASELETQRIAVPTYQRSYSWGSDGQRDQVAEFWNDLRSTFTQSKAEYFLGTVVLCHEGPPDHAAVIDGQQRLATTAILIAAIRDEWCERGDMHRASILQATYLAKSDLRTAELIPQFILNADDDEYFRRRIIDGDPAASPTRASHRFIDSAYQTLRRQVTAIAEAAGQGWNMTLLEWIEYLRDQVRIMVVEVPTEADAFLIFETLNDRGADLTIADLLKNYLFRRAAQRLDTVRNAWVATLANLDIGVNGSQLFTDFLRHYWSSRYGATRERELYAGIKGQITSPPHAVEFTEGLQVASRFYAAILHSDHDVWSSMGAAIRADVDALGVLSLEQNRPLILAAMQHFQASEVGKLLRSMIGWGIRGLVVGGIGGGTAERAYCAAAVKIRKGAIKTTADLRMELLSFLPADDTFRESFAIARIPRSSLARYVLVALERANSQTKEPELVPNQNEQQVNLEHVLPRNATEAEWGQFSEEQRRSYVDRIGNMVLLPKGGNERIGNRPFSTKRPTLARSELALTRQAGEEIDWTPHVIEERQKRLSLLAVKLWPR